MPGQATVFPSALRSATVASADINNASAGTAVVIIDVTATSLAPSFTFTVQGKDEVSGKYFTIIASSAIIATGTTVLRIGPGLTAAANATVNDLLPGTWRVNAVFTGTGDMTFSVGAMYGK